MKITQVIAYPLSFLVTQGKGVSLGLGRTIKRDTVIVKIVTEDGVVGWGESHHGRAPGAMAHFINTTLRELILGMDSREIIKVWRSEEHTSELQSLMRISYAVFCLKKKTTTTKKQV